MTAGKIDLNSPYNLIFYLIFFISMIIIINFDGFDFFVEETILFYCLLNLTYVFSF